MIENTHSAWRRMQAEESQIPHLESVKLKEEPQGKKSFFSSLFGREFSTINSSINPIKGIYLYGGSGCGKSFLSEIFYANLSIKEKRK
jgi:predicted ATPase